MNPTDANPVDFNIPQAFSSGHSVGMTPPAALVKRYHPDWKGRSHVYVNACCGNMYAVLRW